MSESVAAAIRRALLTAEPVAKVMAARQVARAWRLGGLVERFDVAMPDAPARPDRPELLPPNRMPKRGRGRSERGRIALWHALAHIEFIAIDLALDMAGRFAAEMGPAFVGDFLDVAGDEALHFALLARHLRTMGAVYGDLPAHDGLWQAAAATRHDARARLAVVPMVLEARGLDVTPATLARVREDGDARGAAILARILEDEIRHVRVGTKHFIAACEIRREDAAHTWKVLVKRFFRGSVSGPFNNSARTTAGLPLEWYAGLAS